MEKVELYKVGSVDKPLAVGTHPELSRLIYYQRKHDKWCFPVVMIKEHTKRTNDHEYLGGLNTKKEPWHQIPDEDVIAMVRKAYANGAKTVNDVKKQVPIAIDRIGSVVRQYKLHVSYYQATNQYGGVIKTKTIADLAANIGSNAGTVRNKARVSGMLKGYRIQHIEKWG